METTIDQLRHEIFELHPGVLGQVGLAPALQAVADRQATAGGFRARVAVDQDVAGAQDLLLFALGASSSPMPPVTPPRPL
ncbi:MAG: hypothetical protein M3N43_06685 [Actinomycetota bacterium]|nr:hypothetical protein [Actinomycetota bacterium]